MYRICTFDSFLFVLMSNITKIWQKLLFFSCKPTLNMDRKPVLLILFFVPMNMERLIFPAEAQHGLRKAELMQNSYFTISTQAVGAQCQNKCRRSARLM